MSLLNEALRKKNRELEKGINVYPVQGSLKAEQNNKKKYVLLLFGCLGFTYVAFWLWDLVFPPDSLLKNHPAIQETMVEAALVQAQLPGHPPDVLLPEKDLMGQKSDTLEQRSQTMARPQKVVTDKPIAPVAGAEDQKREISKNAPKVIASKPKSDGPGKPAGQSQPGKSKTEDQAQTTRTSSCSDTAKDIGDPGAETVFYEKALAYHRRGNLTRAIQMYQEVLRKNPQHNDALFNLASVYLESHLFTEAYPGLQRLHDSDPENPQVLLNLAIAEMGLERPQQAISHLNNADDLKEGPKFEICLHKGIVFSKLGDLAQAEACYKKAESLCPSHGRLMFNMAVLYDKLKRYDEALKYYGAFLQIDNGLPGAERKNLQERIKAIQVYVARQ